MSIRIVFGKPGAGKSRYATGRLIEELRETKRNIVTNLPLRLDRLNEYLQQRWPDENIACRDRITLLDDKKLKEFYKERGPGAGVGGVAYFIDEAQIPFNARDWATADRGLFAYLTQHRHQGDDVWALTQAPGNLDKQFRSLAQDFRRLRNDRLVKLGVFRGFDQLRCQHFDVEPSGKAEPYLTEKFQLDPKGIASCYDTSGGIGLSGGGKADIGARAKGLTIGWGAAGLFLLASLVFLVPWGLGQATKKYLGKTETKAQSSKEPVPGIPGTKQGDASRNRPGGPSQPGQLADTTPSPAVWVRGFLARGNKVQVLLTDGRMLTETSKELDRVDRNGATVSGQIIYMAAAKDSPPLPKQSEAPKTEPEKEAKPRDEGSWSVIDGVARLKEPSTLATLSH